MCMCASGVVCGGSGTIQSLRGVFFNPPLCSPHAYSTFTLFLRPSCRSRDACVSEEQAHDRAESLAAELSAEKVAREGDAVVAWSELDEERKARARLTGEVRLSLHYTMYEYSK